LPAVVSWQLSFSKKTDLGNPSSVEYAFNMERHRGGRDYSAISACTPGSVLPTQCSPWDDAGPCTHSEALQSYGSSGTSMLVSITGKYDWLL
jgi:hypothetical protein